MQKTNLWRSKCSWKVGLYEFITKLRMSFCSFIATMKYSFISGRGFRWGTMQNNKSVLRANTVHLRVTFDPAWDSIYRYVISAPFIFCKLRFLWSEISRCIQFVLFVLPIWREVFHFSISQIYHILYDKFIILMINLWIPNSYGFCFFLKHIL